MGNEFDQGYWDRHWRQVQGRPDAGRGVPPNPHLVREVGGLAPGTALEAGCGEGAEAVWLARAGWLVTAVDLIEEALAGAEARAATAGVADRVTWLRADLGSWEPATRFDLVTTHYAHAAMPQLELYDRLGSWVAPGGSLLIVGHGGGEQRAHQGGRHRQGDSHGQGAHEGHGAGHGHVDDHADEPPAEARVTPGSITDRLDPATWEVVTAQERTRILDAPGGAPGTLVDVVVRARRRRDDGGRRDD